MSVLVKGMDMPKGCAGCNLFKSCWEQIFIERDHVDYYTDHKRENCPLVEVPTADVREIVRGEWIRKEDYDGDIFYTCSACGEPWCTDGMSPLDYNMNFCPNCGADMRKEDIENKDIQETEEDAKYFAQCKLAEQYDENGDPYRDFEGNPW